MTSWMSHEDTGMFGDEEDYDDTMQDGDDIDATPTKPSAARKEEFVAEISGPATEPKELILRTEQLMEELAGLLGATSPNSDDEYSDSDVDMDGPQALPLEIKEEQIRKYSKQFLTALQQAALKTGGRRDPLAIAYHTCSLLLPLHHSTASTAEVLRKWLFHSSPYPSAANLKNFKTFHPNYVCSSDFWPIVTHLTLRGEIHEVIDIIHRGKWDLLCKDTPVSSAPSFQASASGKASKTRYTSTEVSAIKQAISQFLFVLQKTPGKGRNSYLPPHQLFYPPNITLDSPGTPAEWRIYRGSAIKACSELLGIPPMDQQRKKTDDEDETDDSYYAPAASGFGFGSSSNQPKDSGFTSRKLPAEFTRNLRVLYEILQGNRDTILSASETWQEAVVALTTWTREVDDLSDEDEQDENWAYDPDTPLTEGDLYIVRQRLQDRELERLQNTFEELMEAGDHPLDSTDYMQIGAASAISLDPEIIQEIAKHSLLAASAVVEIGGYAGWVLREKKEREGGRSNMLDEFEEDEMQLLGISASDIRGDPEGMRMAVENENVLRSYVAALMGTEWIDEETDVEGWEIAAGVMGRIENGRELAEQLLPQLPPSSPSRTSKLIIHCSTTPHLASTASKIAFTFANSLPHNAFGQRLHYLSLSCSDTDEEDETVSTARHQLHETIQHLIQKCLSLRSVFPSPDDADETLSNMLSSPAAVESDTLRIELAGYASLRRWFESKDVKALVSVIRAAGEQIDGGIWDREWGCNVEPRWIPGLGREFAEVLKNGKEDAVGEIECLEREMERGDGIGMVRVQNGWEKGLRLGVSKRLAKVWMMS
ncbi:hypothetical protein EX30DRAFT_1369 [Ascodesmis nigricans]|uniref:Nuclear pore complex protein Nup85 n=1 Tax=Ascodesmis nigricans TaxID=341454 RepID=A0A4S2N5E6_9PEZI|nr:hypothetical protein EX30DRAFT_1369 [Ascodesmis nigricans]